MHIIASVNQNHTQHDSPISWKMKMRRGNHKMTKQCAIMNALLDNVVVSNVK